MRYGAWGSTFVVEADTHGFACCTHTVNKPVGIYPPRFNGSACLSAQSVMGCLEVAGRPKRVDAGLPHQRAHRRPGMRSPRVWRGGPKVTGVTTQPAPEGTAYGAGPAGLPTELSGHDHRPTACCETRRHAVSRPRCVGFLTRLRCARHTTRNVTAGCAVPRRSQCGARFHPAHRHPRRRGAGW